MNKDSRFSPSLRIGWNTHPVFSVFGFFSIWKWQQPSRYGYTIRFGWLLIMLGTPAKNEPFLDTPGTSPT